MKYGESILTQLKKKIEKKDIPVRKWPNNAKYKSECAWPFNFVIHLNY